jgi:hypothetical protein
MAWCQFCFFFSISGNYDTVNLHIPGSGCTAALSENIIQKITGNLLLSVFTNALPVEKDTCNIIHIRIYLPQRKQNRLKGADT